MTTTRTRSMLHITPMERRLLQLLAQGRGSRDIGMSLDLALSEVGSCVTALFAKMGVAGQEEAIADASRRGLLID